MGNFYFDTGNNQWEIWISLQATINEKFGFRYMEQSILLVARIEIQISH
jgi:hypothetical protein